MWPGYRCTEKKSKHDVPIALRNCWENRKSINSLISLYYMWLHVMQRVADEATSEKDSRKKKKEEFPGIMKTCGLGTPFPRSALFLLTRLWKIKVSHKIT
jgi:hypothetical protein